MGVHITACAVLPASAATGPLPVVPMLPNLLTLHPHLSVQLVRITSVEDFFSRQVDCALLPGDVVGATLAGRELRPGRIVLVASPDYLSRHGKPEQPSELQRHRCITLVQHDGQVEHGQGGIRQRRHDRWNERGGGSIPPRTSFE